MTDFEDFGIQLEQEKIVRLREIVDPVCRAIVEGRYSFEEAQRAIDQARLEAAMVIPDQLERYDLIYGNRFQRLLEQFPPQKINED